MRSETIQNEIYLEFPDAVAFAADKNSIRVTSMTSDPVGARFTFTNSDSDTVTLDYNSEQNFLVFSIGDVIRRLCSGQHQTLTVTGSVSNDGAGYNITPFSMVIERGRTLNDRPHGCVRTMYYKDDNDLAKVDIYVPVGGTATVGNYVYPLTAGVNAIDLTQDQYGTAITPPSGDFSMAIHLSYSHSDTPTFFGDLWKHSNGVIGDQTNYTISFKQETSGYDCGDGNSYSNYFKIKFLNTDGCWETFVGKMKSKKMQGEYLEYAGSGIVSNTPMAYVGSVTDTVSVGFEDIELDAYFGDIVFAQEVMYENGYGEMKNCVLSKNNITEEGKDGIASYETEIKILA